MLKSFRKEEPGRSRDVTVARCAPRCTRRHGRPDERRPGPDDYYPDPFGTDCQENFIATSAETLRQAAAAVNYKTIVGD